MINLMTGIVLTLSPMLNQTRLFQDYFKTIFRLIQFNWASTQLNSISTQTLSLALLSSSLLSWSYYPDHHSPLLSWAPPSDLSLHSWILPAPPAAPDNNISNYWPCCAVIGGYWPLLCGISGLSLVQMLTPSELQCSLCLQRQRNGAFLSPPLLQHNSQSESPFSSASCSSAYDSPEIDYS